MERRGERESIEKAIGDVCRSWRGIPEVVGWRVSLGPDSTNDPSVFVTVILAELTQDKEWTSNHLDPLMDQIRNAVAETGSEPWAYTSFRRPSDLTQDAVA